jgi:hypothetical protein
MNALNDALNNLASTPFRVLRQVNLQLSLYTVRKHYYLNSSWIQRGG